jgi:hypothetical protein
LQIKKFPETESEFADFVALVSSVGIILVTEEDACSHLQENNPNIICGANSAADKCEAHGGSYNTNTKVCDFLIQLDPCENPVFAESHPAECSGFLPPIITIDGSCTDKKWSDSHPEFCKGVVPPCEMPEYKDVNIEECSIFQLDPCENPVFAESHPSRCSGFMPPVVDG